jgi:SAM-dependent methyltransferase
MWAVSEKYDQGWHDLFGQTTSHSAALILGYVIGLLKPKSLAEVGCGHGHWLAAAEKFGIVDFFGIDGPWTETSRLLIPPERFLSADLGHKLELGRTFDLVLTAEVAEHIPPEQADQFVENVCCLGPVVLFGAAIPHQRGFQHLNEQWPSYWIAKFAARGYQVFDIVRPRFWTDRSIHYYYRQNLLIFVEESQTELIGRLSGLKSQISEEVGALDMVHPEKFSETANYDSISLRHLLPKLPRAVAVMLKRKLKLPTS